MKANVAPEKLYLDEDESWHLTNPNGDSVEYIRADVFIEKAKKWFEKQNEWFDPNGNRHCDMESFEDFRKYMEESNYGTVHTKIRFSSGD